MKRAECRMEKLGSPLGIGHGVKDQRDQSSRTRPEVCGDSSGWGDDQKEGLGGVGSALLRTFTQPHPSSQTLTKAGIVIFSI